MKTSIPRMLGFQLMYSFRLDSAQATFEHELGEFERHAHFFLREEVTGYLAEVECRAGRGRQAARLGRAAVRGG